MQCWLAKCRMPKLWCFKLRFSKETEGLCCSKGNVKLDGFPHATTTISAASVYEGTDESKHFYQIYENIIVPFK